MTRPEVKIGERHMADPGYYVLVVVRASNSEPATVERHSVLHWGYEKDDLFSIPYPITLGGVDVEDPHILRPDGAVVRADGPAFASFEEFLLAVKAGDV